MFLNELCFSFLPTFAKELHTFVFFLSTILLVRNLILAGLNTLELYVISKIQ